MASHPMVLSDEQLIERYQATGAKPEASAHADELFRRYSERVATWCWRFAGDREHARDLAQDVLMKAYVHLGSFRSDAKFSTWLYSITRNHCLNFAREQAREPLASSDGGEFDLVDQREWDTLAELERQSMANTVRKLVTEALDDTEAQVMMLHYGEDIPLGAVTRILGLTNTSGAKAFIVSAKRKLSVALRRVRAQQARPVPPEARRNSRPGEIQ
jgi:RNA polymerase sigma-70 factor, ECF subfamily